MGVFSFLRKYFVEILIVASILFLSSLAFLPTFYGGGHTHDFFVLTNSAYGFEHFKLHKEFHSAFGWIFHVIQYLSFKIVLFLKLNVNSMIFISSMLLFVSIVIIFLLINSDKNIDKIPNIILLFLLYLLFQFIHAKHGYIFLVFGGFYNLYLYGLYIMQLLYLLSYINNNNKNPINVKKIALINSIFIYICAHYKIHSVLSCGILSFIFFLFFDFKTRLKYLKYVIIFLSAFFFVTLIFGYNYIAYLQDLIMAMQSRKEIANINNNAIKFYYFITINIVLIGIYNIAKFKKLKIFNKFLFPVYNVKIKNINIYFLILILFSFIILIFFDGMFMYFKKYVAYYFLLPIALILIDDKKLKQAVLKQAVQIGILIVIALSIKTKINFINFKIGTSINFITKDNLKYNIIADNKDPFNDKILNNSFDIQTLYQAAFDYDFLYKFSQKRPYSGVVVYSKYIENVNEVLKNNISNQNTKIYMNTLASPVSFYGYQLPKPLYNWLHRGISFNSEKSQEIFNEIFKNSDIIVLPTFGIDVAENILINCIFYKFNKENKKFKLWKITKFAIFFVNENYANENKIKLNNSFKENNNLHAKCLDCIKKKAKTRFSFFLEEKVK